MGKTEMLMVFSYDISDDRRRRKVAKILEESMIRVQQSVFESRLGAAATDRLARQIEGELGSGDSLRIYAIGANGMKRCRTLGGAPLAEDTDFWLL